MDLNFAEIEAKWKASWASDEIYKVIEDNTLPKFYVLDMFPYPSGAGLHVGHPLGYIASDIFSRYKKMSGYNVLHPMGFDAFGLPAEQYAIQTGVHPAVSTEKNIEYYKSQLANLGFNYDWEREVQTCDPAYYKWTQWIFIQLFEHYYDSSDDKAKPIKQLKKKFSVEGNLRVTKDDISFDADMWNNYSPSKKDEILMNYRLAYRKTAYVNWCPALGTVLANDEVKDGLSERGGHPVEKKPMLQWALRITDYAERLLTGLETLDWSEALKAMQRNWIGKSVGAKIYFQLQNFDKKIEVFSTRPDTIYGATFMVIAPEHELVNDITTAKNKAAIQEYLTYVNNRSERERLSEVKQVTGAFTGAYALHPLTNKKIPIWISEYVLKDYGTGAIMAVPSDDDRDHAFATKFGIDIISVVDKSEFPNATAKDKLGKMINSDLLNGLDVKSAIAKAISVFEEKGIGEKKVNYKLRDANYSRQRYWGEPFPIEYKNGETKALSLDILPLELPDLSDFKPTADGKSPLAKLESWVNIDGTQRETDTMPGFAGSSWYFLRYMDPNNANSFVGEKAINYWQEVDLYIGGTEHAVGHLMYARFWHKFLFDIGLVPTDEPFKKLLNQGMIQGVIEYLNLKKEKEDGSPVFVCANMINEDNHDQFVRIPVHIKFIKNYGQSDSHLDSIGVQSFIDWRSEYKYAIFQNSDGKFRFSDIAQKDDFKILTSSEVGKMSKRYFNVVNPDDVLAKYGADCFRMYEMFLGPIEQSKPWDTKGIDGVSKFIRKLWSLFYDEEGNWIVSKNSPTKETYKMLHQTIKKVSTDIESFSFNTCISSFMVCINELKKYRCHNEEILIPLLKLLAPFAPFITEELWSRFNFDHSIHLDNFPTYNESYLKEDTVTLPLCFNGKKRGDLSVDSDLTKDQIIEIALADPVSKKWLAGNPPKKVIVVTGRMINIVI